MCRCEGSRSPHELSFTRVRLHNDLSMSSYGNVETIGIPHALSQFVRKLRRRVRCGH